MSYQANADAFKKFKAIEADINVFKRIEDVNTKLDVIFAWLVVATENTAAIRQSMDLWIGNAAEPSFKFDEEEER